MGALCSRALHGAPRVRRGRAVGRVNDKILPWAIGDCAPTIHPWIAIVIFVVELAAIMAIARVGFGAAVISTAVANLASTFAGMFVTMIPLMVLGMNDRYPLHWWIGSFIVTFFISVPIELPISRALLRDVPRKRVTLGVVTGNVVSYGTLFALMMHLGAGFSR